MEICDLGCSPGKIVYLVISLSPAAWLGQVQFYPANDTPFTVPPTALYYQVVLLVLHGTLVIDYFHTLTLVKFFHNPIFQYLEKNLPL